MILGALLLAGVLVVAGVAKLFDLDGSRRAVEEFGVPRSLARHLGTFLPVAELAAAAALVAAPTPVGGIAALVLLATFSVAIAVSLLRGHAPDCRCFGELHSTPVGATTLARNGVLLTLAAFVAGGGDATATATTAGAALALLAAVVLGRPRAGGDRPEGLAPGTPAPGFAFRDAHGTAHTLASLRADGLPIVLLFTDPDCGPCIALAPKVARWRADLAADVRLVAIERRPEIAELYRAQGTPTAVLIGRDGAVAAPVAAGGAQIEALVTRAAGGLAAAHLRRRDLIVRATGAWAAATAAIAWPAHAARTAIGRISRAEPCEDSFDCPEHVFMSCRDGRCRCDEGFTRCDPEEATDRRCFDLRSHKDHCGSCNHQCTGADHDVCCEGECGEFGQTRCHCGDAPCPGEHDVCTSNEESGGEFFCFPCAEFGWKRCGNECADPDTSRCCGDRIYKKKDLGPGDWRCCGTRRDRRLVNVREHERNCGACGRRCRDGEFCYRGRCRKRCPVGSKRCGDTCISPRTHRCCGGRAVAKSDPRHCGGCGIRCTGPFDTGECCAGTCCDINADTCCPGGCRNLALDDENCGACGNVCGPNSYCRFGVCTCPAEPCP